MNPTTSDYRHGETHARSGWVVTGKPASTLWPWAIFLLFGIAVLALAAGSSILAWLGLGVGLMIVGSCYWHGKAVLTELHRAISSRILSHTQALAAH